MIFKCFRLVLNLPRHGNEMTRWVHRLYIQCLNGTLLVLETRAYKFSFGVRNCQMLALFWFGVLISKAQPSAHRWITMHYNIYTSLELTCKKWKRGVNHQVIGVKQYCLSTGNCPTVCEIYINNRSIKGGTFMRRTRRKTDVKPIFSMSVISLTNVWESRLCA